jgi:hypothetical protein
MALPGETIATGATPFCEDCDKVPDLGVYQSSAGFYIGTYCGCGPFSRESGYYETQEAADTDFKKMNLGTAEEDAIDTRLAGGVPLLGNEVRTAVFNGAKHGILRKS